MCKEETISEFRRYDKINCNEFDLISGKTEPKQTMALGFLLSKSSNALHAFLKFIEVKEEFNRCIVIRISRKKWNFCFCCNVFVAIRWAFHFFDIDKGLTEKAGEEVVCLLRLFL